MDFYDQRKPLIFGQSSKGLCMIVVASSIIGFGSPQFKQVAQVVEFSFPNTLSGNATVDFMFLDMVFFGAFFASIPWTYEKKVFTLNARGRGSRIGNLHNMFCKILIGTLYL
ncbi:uncharacterized protein PV09_08630 [Verruconis gallopava]|uniref:Uncharacterized protein n=1 Tax=Verruconis gallopava TaxID=253628 RepID=A0A0D1ZZ38_9PEZI|nr:uncharacterized protein PV09_08630 [Verruconis gallopava]KIV99697.1 hypothetical protein PV09_08630 [Verruconis gallopava]